MKHRKYIYKFLTLALAAAMVLSCAACGKTEAPPASPAVSSGPVENTPVPPAQTPPQEQGGEEEDVFVPDYAEGKENYVSFLDGNMLWLQQDGWLYYGSDGKYLSLRSKDHILKMPVGGTQEDVVQIYDCYGAEGTVYNFDCECGHKPDSAEMEKLLAVMGDWIYLQLGDEGEGHIYRLRTDGKVMEQVLCLRPDENTKRFYWAMRDSSLYFIEEGTVQLDASTKETRRTFHALRMDAESYEIEQIADAPDIAVTSYNAPGNFVLEGEFYFRNQEDGQYYCFDRDENFAQLTFFEYTYKDKSIYEDLVTNTRFPLLAEFGLDGKVYLYAGVEENFVPEYGVYQVDSLDWDALPSGFTLTDDERDNDVIWSALQPYLVPYSGYVLWPEAVAVEGGIVIGGYDSPMLFYSFDTKETTQINNDGGFKRMEWPGDGYLYYSIGEDEIYRVKLDGSGWEDMSWITCIPENLDGPPV